jgi:hypothetical protein
MTDDRHDDEVLGRALSRAIETQTPNETPFERSRIADRPARRGFGVWQLAGVAAALVLALAFGSWFTRPNQTGPVAASPTSSVAAPTATRTTSSAPAASPSAISAPNVNDHGVVYFARDGSAPVGVHVPGLANEATREQRIASRVNALNNGSPVGSRIAVPVGAFNAFPLQDPALLHVSSVEIQGDTAIVDIALPGSWRAFGPIQSVGLQRQLVYTITEEPGVRRAIVRQNGTVGSIDAAILWDKPLSREDVFGYAIGSTKTAQGFGDANSPARKLTVRTSVDTVAVGLARVVIDTDLQQISPTILYPDFNVDVIQDLDPAKPLGAKWYLRVSVAHGIGTPDLRVIDQTPLRSLSTTQVSGTGFNGAIIDIGLDDLRPWRTAIAFNPFRIIVDIGGDPQLLETAGSNAVYAPARGATVGHTFQVSGIAHNFEAHVDIRVLDDKMREIYRGSTTATTCCDPGGSFDATVQLPATVTGAIYLEVYEASARDGSDTKLIRVPLTVR